MFRTTKFFIFSAQFFFIYSSLVAAPFGYVSNRDSDSVSVLDLKTDQILQSISVGDLPLDIVLANSRKYLYVANYNSETISVIDTQNNMVVETISIGKKYNYIYLTPNDKELWIPLLNEYIIDVMSTQSYSIQQIPMEYGPVDVAITPDGKKAIVTCEADDKVVFFDAFSKNILASIGAYKPRFIAIKHDGNYAYVTSLYSNGIQKIDTRTYEITTISNVCAAGMFLGDIAISPDDQYAYASASNNTISRINLLNDDITQSFAPTASSPRGIAITSDSTYAYVCNANSNNLTKIELSTGNYTTIAGAFSAPTKIALPKFSIIEGFLDFSPVKYQR